MCGYIARGMPAVLPVFTERRKRYPLLQKTASEQNLVNDLRPRAAFTAAGEKKGCLRKDGGRENRYEQQ